MIENTIVEIYSLRNSLFDEKGNLLPINYFTNAQYGRLLLIKKLKAAEEKFDEEIIAEQNIEKIISYIKMYLFDEHGEMYPYGMFADSKYEVDNYLQLLHILENTPIKNDAKTTSQTDTVSSDLPLSQASNEVKGEDQHVPKIVISTQNGATEQQKKLALSPLGNIKPLRKAPKPIAGTNKYDYHEIIFNMMMNAGFDINDPVLVEFIPWFSPIGFDKISEAATLDQQDVYFERTLSDIARFALSKEAKINSIINSIYFVNSEVNSSIIAEIEKMGERLLDGIFSEPSSVERYNHLNHILNFDNKPVDSMKSLI